MSGLPPSASRIHVHLLPELADPHALAGHDIVVVDVLRASTTLAAALAGGVAGVVPCLEVAEARQLASERRSQGRVLIGGERGGQRISGFDLGNSPSDYSPENVANATVVFTTTNGTRAMMRCVGAGRVIIGSFVNLSAVASVVEELTRVDVICAGTNGEVSWEDTLFAGALVARLNSRRNRSMNDAAKVAESAWHHIGGGQLGNAGLAEAMRLGSGGQNLIAIGQEDDIRWAAQIDKLDVVPELRQADWIIDHHRPRGAGQG